jgi:hypothetical protein
VFGTSIERLACVEERLLQREVVARRDEQLMRHASFAKQRRERGEEPVHSGRRRALGEQRVQLVVERPRALRQRDELRDAGQVRRLARRIVEPRGKTGGDVLRVRADDGDETAGEQQLGHLLDVLLRRRRRRGRM